MSEHICWIPKPEPGASLFAKEVKAIDMSPFVEPVMTIEGPKECPAVEKALIKPETALLISSPHALQFCSLVEPLKKMPAYAVGARAEAMLQKQGHKGYLMMLPTIDDVLEIIEKKRDEAHFTKITDVLYFSGEHISRDITEPLEKLDIHVHRKITYQQKAASDLSDVLVKKIKDKQVQFVCLTSPRMASLCAHLLKKHDIDPEDIIAVCQSSNIAKEAMQSGFERRLLASIPNNKGLINSLKKAIHAPS